MSALAGYTESAFFFDCQGEALPAVVTAPEQPAETGVLVIVGGPQYRAGSHRQFVLLSRQVAAAGFACMRFDYRGMGDATGEARIFEQVDDDIRAAVDAFFVRQPALRRVVLWGLCDGASAACFYAHQDDRVAGLVLLNPWVKTDAGQARTMLKYYYVQRLLSLAFWKKLLSGGVSVGRSLGGLNQMVVTARKDDEGANTPLPARMAQSLKRAGRPFLVMLSGRDYVAREFEQAVTDPAWADVPQARNASHMADADHTFSSAKWRDEVARQTVSWLQALATKAI
ncbi:hydrolase 1, exosortase A system-associated [Azoarcus communis]|uniref:hydrolase 1, exosortase A system-associated n=1 Tax=Parazoarcus communis TaxID=41977 RepID=UPI001459DBB2|nr:hydrolase 1, exosortase A system-associated [Parazoarcus communis]NMG47421.1 hydrolase 1, exosortase A system-associated [Parazoarcus communis]